MRKIFKVSLVSTQFACNPRDLRKGYETTKEHRAAC